MRTASRVVLVSWFGLLALPGGPLIAADGGAIVGVMPDRGSINPNLGDTVRIAVELRRAGIADLEVIDRDGYLVRTVAREAAVVAGPNAFSWDGRDERGSIVPDEAYSFRVRWTDGRAHETYFPADTPAHMSALQADYYSARTATLAYTLAVPSRVHLQAGTVTKNPKTGKLEGPVLKTIVNREPRAAGRVAEPWNGLDESGAIRVTDLPDFVISIAAVPLPSGSVITYGNRSLTFAEAALGRTGESLFTKRKPSDHHAGLSVFEDLSPRMELRPLNAMWSKADRAWRVDGPTLRLQVSLGGPSASHFARQPGEIYRFVDGRLKSITRRPARTPSQIDIPLRDASDLQVVAINWRSEFGGVAANAIRVIRAESRP